MADKTNLTNPAVQGSAETDPSLEREGKHGLNGSEEKDEKGVSWKNRAMEAQSKYEAVTEKYEAVNARLAELDEKIRLTESEKAEQRRLENRQSGLEDQLRIFETDPQFGAAREHINRKTEDAYKRAKEEGKTEALSAFYKNEVNRILARESKKLDMKPGELANELFKLQRVSHQELDPKTRIYELLDEYTTIRKDKKSREANAENEHFVEGDGRLPRETTLDDAIKSKDIQAQMRHLGL